jgi:hypothetical protein
LDDGAIHEYAQTLSDIAELGMPVFEGEVAR